MKTRSLLEFSRYKYKILGYPSYMQTDTCTCTYIIQLSKNSKKDVGQIALTIVNHPNILTLIIV